MCGKYRRHMESTENWEINQGIWVLVQTPIGRQIHPQDIKEQKFWD